MSEGYSGLPPFYLLSSDPVTMNLGLSLKGMDPIVAEDFYLVDQAFGTIGIKVNGAVIPNVNINDAVPAAPPGNVNVVWQVSGSNVSGYVPVGLNSVSWSSLTNALADLNLNNGAFNTTIGGTGFFKVGGIMNAVTGYQVNGVATLGHVLRGNGTNFVDAQLQYGDLGGTVPTPPSGAVLWSALGNAAADLTLANAGFNTTFNQTSAVNWTWANTTAATTTLVSIAPGAGAVNVNSVASGTMTLNINIGDCVIIYISGSVAGTSSTLSDNGSSGGNTYTRIPALDTASYGFNSAYYCVSATKSATTITVTGGTRYWTQGATFTGVASIGASHLTNTSGAGSPASDSVTTTANNSLVIAGGNINGTAFTATSGNIVASSGSGAFLLTQTVITSGTVATSSGTYTGAGKQWQIASIELQVAAATFASHSSPILNIDGTYWNGSASAVDAWTIQDVISNAQNGASTLTLLHSGSSGLASVSLPNLLSITGSSAQLNLSTDNGISRLGAGSLAIGNGTASDFSGSLKLTGLSVQGALTDGSASVGTAGQVLTSTGTKVAWAAPGGGGGSGSGTGQNVSIILKAGNYNPTVNDYVVVYSATAAAVLNSSLPTGTTYLLKLTGAASTLTISTTSGLIDGAATQIITTQYGSIGVVFDGTNWNVV